MTIERGNPITEMEHVRELMKHPGWAVVLRHIAARRAHFRDNWFRAASPTEAEYIRQEARNYEAFLNIIKAILINGEQARKASLDLQLPPTTEQGAE